jgi:alcohol dehydrogenase, propanol-preferring
MSRVAPDLRAPAAMSAMRLHSRRQALALEDVSLSRPGQDEVVLEVAACGVCRTDLHLLDGELPNVHYPVTPGHEIVGRVLECGSRVTDLRCGDRVGVPWLGYACGTCDYCRRGAENLCENAKFTGYTLDGGYAQYAVADARFCLKIPEQYSDTEAAPLLCAGLIGYRAYRTAGDTGNLGLYGFGAAAHLLAQLARSEGRRVYAFTRPGDLEAQSLARELGAVWTGGSDETPAEALDSAIIFAPDGALVPTALRATRKGGRVVCAGIHMSDIPSFPYELLWGERTICSVANLTRADGKEFMRVASRLTLRPTVTVFALERANEALQSLRSGALIGCAVLQMNNSD